MTKRKRVIKRTDQWVVSNPDLITVQDGFNARKRFTKIKELAEDIKAHGLYNPLLVRRNPVKEADAPFVLVDGNRRYLALKRLFEDPDFSMNIPVRILRLDDAGATDVMARANMSREDFMPSEKAALVRRYLDNGFSQNDVAARLGVSQAWVARFAVFSRLASSVQRAVDKGDIAFEAAMILARTFKTEEAQVEAAKQVVEGSDSVRSTAKTAKVLTGKAKKPSKKDLRLRAASLQKQAKSINPDEGRVPVVMVVDLVCTVMSFAAGDTTEEDFKQKMHNIVGLD